MTPNDMQGRRSFLKKAAVSTGIAGGVLSTAQPAAAVTSTLKVEGDGDGTYTITVGDPDAYAGNDLESGDSVTNYSSESVLEGSVTSGDTDTFYFEGRILSLVLSGDLNVTVSDTNGLNLYSDVVVEGTDNAYSIQMTHDINKTSDCESDDSTDSTGTIANGQLGFSDTDTWDAAGNIEFVSILKNNSVTINNKF